MEAIRLETVVPEDKILKVPSPTLEVGESVEIIVLRSRKPKTENRYPLWGTPYRYDAPFSPAVPVEDWEANG